MNIYSFLNSRDIAEHCRSIGKVWTTFEMAVIIGRSNIPLKDKHTAWRELITNYPDMPTPENIHVDASDSMHKKLTELIVYEERIFELFKTPEPGAVYVYEVRCSRKGDTNKSESGFTEYEETLENIKDLWLREEVSKIEVVRFFPYVPNNEKGNIVATLDYDGNLYNLSVYNKDTPRIVFHNTRDLNDTINEQLSSFFIDIPMPFKRGDLLIANYGNGNKSDVFVLDYLARNDQSIIDRHKKGKCDDMHMKGNGFFVDDDGILYWDHTGNDDCYEYYRGKLEGKERLLHYVNLFIHEDKKEIGLPELLTMQCRIMLENKLNNGLRINGHGCYIPENLLAENRLTKEEKEQIIQTNGLMPWVVGKLSIYQVEFLAKEIGCSKETVQYKLCNSGGDIMSKCAGIVHEENHYEKINDDRYNYERKAMAKLILESYGYTEKEWINKYAD